MKKTKIVGLFFLLFLCVGLTAQEVSPDEKVTIDTSVEEKKMFAITPTVGFYIPLGKDYYAPTVSVQFQYRVFEQLWLTFRGGVRLDACGFGSGAETASNGLVAPIISVGIDFEVNDWLSIGCEMPLYPAITVTLFKNHQISLCLFPLNLSPSIDLISHFSYGYKIYW